MASVTFNDDIEDYVLYHQEIASGLDGQNSESIKQFLNENSTFLESMKSVLSLSKKGVTKPPVQDPAGTLLNFANTSIKLRKQYLELNIKTTYTSHYERFSVIKSLEEPHESVAAFLWTMEKSRRQKNRDLELENVEILSAVKRFLELTPEEFCANSIEMLDKLTEKCHRIIDKCEKLDEFIANTEN